MELRLLFLGEFFAVKFLSHFSAELLVFSLNVCFSYVVRENQVNFYLYTRDHGEVQITESNFELLDTSKTFHFIIHGWVANHELLWVQSMTDAYLEQADCNVIQVDWQEPAFEAVYVSANNTKGVG